MAVIPIISPVRRRFWLSVLIFGVLLVLPLTWLQPDSLVSVDSGVYATGAWSLAQGRGYRLVTHIASPPITLYPPLTSAYLSLWFDSKANFLASVPGIHLGMVLLGASCGLLWFWFLARAGCPDWFAALTALSFGLSNRWLEMFVSPMSEPLFLFFMLVLANIWVNAPRMDSAPRWLLTGLLAGLLYLTRTAALGLIAGLGLLTLLQFRQGKWKTMTAFVLPVLAAMGWWYWMKLSKLNTSYESALTARVLELNGWHNTVIFMGKSVLNYLSGVHWLDGPAPMLVRLPWMAVLAAHHLTWAGWAILAAVAAAFMAVTLHGCWTDRHPTMKWARLPAALYLLQLFLWPYFLGVRGLWVLLPFAIRWTWLGFDSLTGSLRWQKPLKLLLMLGLFLNVLTNVFLDQKLISEDCNLPLIDEVRETAAYASRHIPPGAPIASNWYHLFVHFSAFSGRELAEDYYNRINLGQTYTPVRIEDQHVMPRYLLASRLIEHYALLEAFLKQHPGLMTVVFESSHGSYLLLRINEQEQLRLWQKDHGVAPPP